MSAQPGIPELLLERLHLGELPEEEAQRVRKALAADPQGRERLAALVASDAEILSALPPGVFAREVARRSLRETPAPRRRRAPAALWAAAACALAVGVVVRGVLPAVGPGAPGAAAGDRVKGGAPSLLLFRDSGPTGPERLASGDVGHAQDVVQLAYQAGGGRYGVILSIDGRGVVTRHLPRSGGRAALLRSVGTGVLDAAYRLDDAPRAERFYLVVAGAPFDVAPILEAAASAGLDPLAAERLPLGAGFDQVSFLLRKE